MKKSITAIIGIAALFLFSFKPVPYYQNDNPLKGAWGYHSPEGETVMICTDHVFAIATYDFAGKKLIRSTGGSLKLVKGHLVRKIEWDSKDSTEVGHETEYDFQVTGNTLTIADHSKWERLDDGKPGALEGAWVITGNYNNDKVSKRPNPFYPRRTMKVLSGKYFHWIAYNVATKQFLNAGGGKYTTENGRYTEEIEFFTKTPESIGKKLQFSYAFVDGDWRHKGEKSTGGPLDECWSRRETLEK